MVARAVELARRRWVEFLALVICIHWMPRVLITLFGTHYAVGSGDVGAITAYGLQSMAIAFCSALMQASVVTVGLDGASRRLSPQAAITRVLRRLPTLSPLWLLGMVPIALRVFIRWSVHTDAQLAATYYWQEFGSTAYFIALDSLLGLYPVIALGEGLPWRPTLSRAMKLTSSGRGAILAVAVVGGVASLVLNLAMPYATDFALKAGLGEAGYHGAYFVYVFVWDARSVLVNLVWVQLYLELGRAHDGVAPGEVAQVFA